MYKKIPLLVKIILIHIIFMLLHYLYDWYPNDFTAMISGINESVYQHMKIGFFAYLLFVFIEFLLMRKHISIFSAFAYSRLFSATCLPLVMMVIYLSGPLVFGQFESVLYEVIFANIALLATSFTTLVIENQIEKSKPGNLFRIVIIILFILSFIEYIMFTFKLPWFDIFAVPPGF